MSKYTTQVRYICESKAGIIEPFTNIPYSEIIERARPYIFNFYYPIWDNSKRKELETNILKHFYTNEIGQETFQLWQMRLDDWMNSYMPYYNPLFEALDKQYSMFLTDDFTITRDENTEHHDINTEDRTKNSSMSGSSSNNSTYGSNSKANNEETNTHIDTPQGSLDNFLAGKYMSDADHNTSNGTNDFNSTGNSSGNTSSTQNDTNNTKENRDGNEHRKLEHLEKGYRGRSMVSIMNDYIEGKTNIYNRLYSDMEPLFMQIW